MTLPAIIPQFTMGDIERVALAIAKGGLFGSKDPNAVLTLCLLAQAEGQHPAVVFRDYHIINGKPAKKAEAMLRDFISSGGKVEWHGLTDELADATFSHPGGGTVRIDWTLERARQAGIANPMWKKYPRQMLRSRVISEGVRSVCPSATSGLYEVGEVQDIVAENRSNGGVVEGQFEESTVSPDIPAERPAARTKLEGPYTSITALERAVKAFDSDLRGCGDLGELEGLLSTDDAKALRVQLNRDAPYFLDGGEGMPEEFEPLDGLVNRLRYQFEQLETANHMTDLINT